MHLQAFPKDKKKDKAAQASKGSSARSSSAAAWLIVTIMNRLSPCLTERERDIKNISLIKLNTKYDMLEPRPPSQGTCQSKGCANHRWAQGPESRCHRIFACTLDFVMFFCAEMKMKTFSCLKTRSPVFSIFSHGSISMAVLNCHLHSSVTDLRPWWIGSRTEMASGPRLWADSTFPTASCWCGWVDWSTTSTFRHERSSFVLWGVVKTTAGNLAGVSVLFFTFFFSCTVFVFRFCFSSPVFHFHFPLFKHFMFFLLAAFLAALFGFASLMPPAAKDGVATMPRSCSTLWALLVRLQPALQHQQRPGRPRDLVSWMCLAMFFLFWSFK